MSRVQVTDGEDGSLTYRIHVSEPSERRLDTYLSEQLRLSRSQIAALIEAGRVRVGGGVPKKSYVPELGDEVVVEMPAPQPTEAVAEDSPIPIEVSFEDEGFLVVNKPAGMVVHPAPGHPRGTLVNALLHRVGRLSPLGGSRRPGVVHRLDKDTSGLIIVAKDESVHRRLSDMMSRRKIERRYLAASWGHLPEESMRIEADVGRHRRDRKRMAVVPEGRPAVTEVERLERWRSADLLRLRLKTGRTHQIRVHLRHIGHPVVGDAQYAMGWERGLRSAGGRWAEEFARRVGRQFLHAAELRFTHPLSGEALEFVSQLPADLEAAAQWARASS